MSCYIIAGVAGDPAFALCQHLGEKLQKSAPSVSVRCVMKHPSEWEPFLKSVCNGYGFSSPSSPIVFTVDGKLIGGKSEFKRHVLFTYGLKSNLGLSEKTERAEFDISNLEEQRKLQARGPLYHETVLKQFQEAKQKAVIDKLDGFFESRVIEGIEWFVKVTEKYSPFGNDNFQGFGEDLEFVNIPEIESSEEIAIDEEVNAEETQETQEAKEQEQNSQPTDNEELEEDQENQEDQEPQGESQEGSASEEQNTDEEDSLINFEINERNIQRFIEKFKGIRTDYNPSIAEPEYKPSSVKTVVVPKANLVTKLEDNYLVVLHPYPLIENNLIVFQEDKNEEEFWMVRDSSMAPNWLKLLSIPPQRPVYKDGEVVEPKVPKEPVYIKGTSGNLLSSRGFSNSEIDFGLECSRNSSLRLNTINVRVQHLLTESDWEKWYQIVKELNGVGFYQVLPYKERGYQPLSLGHLNLFIPPAEEIPHIPLQKLFEEVASPDSFFTLEEYEFDHVIHLLKEDLKGEDFSQAYIECISQLGITGENFEKYEAGMVILLFPKFMFVAPMYRPFEECRGRKAFPDPLWYAGIFNLPVLPPQYPQTLGVPKEENPIQLLKRVSKVSIS